MALMFLISTCTRPSASPMVEEALAWGRLECKFTGWTGKKIINWFVHVYPNMLHSWQGAICAVILKATASRQLRVSTIFSSLLCISRWTGSNSIAFVTLTCSHDIYLHLLQQKGPPCPLPTKPPGGPHAVSQHRQLAGHHQCRTLGLQRHSANLLGLHQGQHSSSHDTRSVTRAWRTWDYNI